MSEKLQAILNELRDKFQALYEERLVQMILYGSQVRGDACQGSDIDVMIVLSETVNPGAEISRTSEIVADISLKYDEVISCVFMDEDKFTHRNGPLLRNVRREGISV